MQKFSKIFLPLAMLTGLLCLSVLSGCGGVGGPSGSTGNSGIPPKTSLGNATEDPTKPSSIGGSIFTMLPPPGQTSAIIDQAYNATVTINRTDGGAVYFAQTQSTVRGGYIFPNVPAGVYTVAATVSAAYATNSVVSASLIGVHARGNIPTLMVNLLLGQSTQMATLTGIITQDGHAANGAVVSVDIKGYTPYYIEGTLYTVSVILSTTTDANGRYTFAVPIGGLTYFVAAHDATSAMSEMSTPFTSLAPGDQKEVNLTLPAATTPTFTTLTMDLLSCTLPQQTSKARQQALISRLAVARTRRASAVRLTRLENLVRSSQLMRAPSSLVENDLYWYADPGGTEVNGYNVYRGGSTKGPFTMVGAALDPYMLFFYDNDPSLQPGTPQYYTVCSFAAGGATSNAAVPVLANPLPRCILNTPADGATVPVGSATVSWTAVPGALSYVVTKFNAEPTFNILSVGSNITHTATDTSEKLTGLAPGNYWWSVSAYDTADPNQARAAAFTEYRKITLQ